MIEVIQINATDREVAQLLDRRGRFHVRENGRLRFEGKRDKSGKSPRFILQLSEQTQVINPLFQRLDMPK